MVIENLLTNRGIMANAERSHAGPTAPGSPQDELPALAGASGWHSLRALQTMETPDELIKWVLLCDANFYVSLQPRVESIDGTKIRRVCHRDHNSLGRILYRQDTMPPSELRRN
jgi:hypothetical protein